MTEFHLQEVRRNSRPSAQELFPVPRTLDGPRRVDSRRFAIRGASLRTTLPGRLLACEKGLPYQK